MGRLARQLGPNAIVLLVPPPDRPEIARVDRWLARGLAIIVGSVTAVLWGARDRTNSWIVVGSITTLFVLGLLEVMAIAANWSARRWRKRVWGDHPYELLPDERKILNIWKRPSKAPSPAAILHTLYGERNPDHCVVACFGFLGFPETIDDVPFEPTFITPMDRQGRDMSAALALVAVAAAVWGLSQFAIPAMCGGVCLGGAMYGLVPTTLIWFWCVALRPVYWRVRPQQIDVLRYRPFSQKARTRSYPIRPGTVIQFIGGPEQPRLIVSDGQHSDSLFLHSLPTGSIDQILRAIIAAKPSPAMPDDELLG